MDIASLDALTITLSTTNQLILAGALVTMMFALSLSLSPSNFSFLRSHPKLFWGGLGAQLIALPIVTILVAMLLQPAPSIALGMIVVAACPGGNVSNLMTYAARGDTAYSVSLTAGSSIIATLWTPAAILFWSGLYPPTAQLLETIDFNRVAFVLQTTLMLAVPLALGMTARWYRPDIAEKIRNPLALFGAGALGMVIIVGTIDFWPILVGAFATIMIPVIAHNTAAFGLGLLTGQILTKAQAQRRALTFEIGIQNTGLAIVLLLAQLKGLGGAAAIAAVWGVWHFFSGGAMIAFYRHRDKRKPQP